MVSGYPPRGSSAGRWQERLARRALRGADDGRCEGAERLRGHRRGIRRASRRVRTAGSHGGAPRGSIGRGRGRAGQSRGRGPRAHPGRTLADRPRPRDPQGLRRPRAGSRAGSERRGPLERDRRGPAGGELRRAAGDVPRVRGADAVVAACRRCFASLFTDRAIVYRIQHGFDHLAVRLSIGVQHMVARRSGSGRGPVHARSRERLPGRGGDQRRLRPGRGRRPGAARPRRVLDLQADAARGRAGRFSSAPLGGKDWKLGLGDRRHAGTGRGPGPRRARAPHAWPTTRCWSWRVSGSRSRPTTRRGRPADADGHRVGARRRGRAPLHCPGAARRRCTGPSAGR